MKSILFIGLVLLLQLNYEIESPQTIKLETVNQIRIIQEFSGEPTSLKEMPVAFSADSRILGFVDGRTPWGGGQIYFFDVATFEPLQLIVDEPVSGTTLHFTNSSILVGTLNGLVERYSLESGKLVETVVVSPASSDINDPIYTLGGDVEVITSSSDEQYFAVAATSELWGENVFYLSAFDEEPILKISAGQPPYRALGRGYDVVFHPNDEFVVLAARVDDGTGNWTNTVQIRDVQTGNLLASCDLFNHTIAFTHNLVVSPDGTQIIYKAEDGIRIWDTRNCADHNDAWTLLLPAIEGEWVTTMEVHPTEPILVVALGMSDHGRGVLQFWNIQTQQLVHEITDYGSGIYNEITNLAFSPDGTMLATGAGGAGSEDATVRLWGIPADD